MNLFVPGFFYWGQPKAASGYKMLPVPFLFTRDYFMSENLRVDIYRDVFTSDHVRVNLLSRIKTNIYQNYLYINLLQNVSLLQSAIDVPVNQAEFHCDF